MLRAESTCVQVLGALCLLFPTDGAHPLSPLAKAGFLPQPGNYRAARRKALVPINPSA